MNLLGRISASIRMTISIDLKRLVLNVEDLAELMNQDGFSAHRSGLSECREHLTAARRAYDAAMVEHVRQVCLRFAGGLRGHNEKESTL